MGLFQYRYINAKGKKKSGHVDAESLNEAKEKLRLQHLFITAVKECSFQKRKGRFSKSQEIPQAHLIALTTQLAQLLTAGMPLFESLLLLEEQYRHEQFQPILLSLSEQIKKGKPFSEALELYPHSFSPIYCSMIAAGESVGALDKSLERLVDLLNKQNKLKKQLVAAIMYPALLLGFSLFVSLLMLTLVIPSLESLFEERSVNGFTQTVFSLSKFLTTQWHFYLPFLFISLIGVCYAASFDKAKQLWQKTLLKLPFIAPLLIQTAIARFARTCSALLQGGVALLKTMQIARPVMQSPLLEREILHAESKMIEGSLLSRELKKSSLIPPLVPRLLSIGEESGKMGDMFVKIADLYEEEVDKNIGRITALAQPVILVFMGAIVGLIMLAVLLPLTDINAFI